MNCREFQEIMNSTLDQEMNAGTRKQVALHLTSCPDCLQLIQEDTFWDEAVIGLLNREAPEGLRREILGDLADRPGLSGLGWKNRLKLIGWGSGRKTSAWNWLEVAAVLAVFLLLIPALPYLTDRWSFSSPDPFQESGPVVMIGDNGLLSHDSFLVTSSLEFEGRLF